MIKSKKLLAVAMVGALGLAACGSDDETTTDTAAPAEAEAPADGDAAADGEGGSICEVTDVGGVDDKGFNQIAFEGAERAAEDFGLTAQVLESASDADYETNIQSFIEQDCSLIVTVGFLLGDATAAASAANPDQQFAIIDVGYPDPIPNVLTLNFDVAPPSFLAGYLAAGMTETGKVATYGGINIPPVTVFMDGFANGVAYYNEQKGTEVEVLGWDVAAQDGSFAGNFENLDDGKALAASFADEGADIIFPVAGPVGLGSSAYAVETGGVRIIGVDNDGVLANPNESSVYLTSVLKKIDEAVYAAAQQVIVDSEAGGAYVGTLENDGVGLAPYHEQDGDIPQELKDEVEALRLELIAGNVLAN